MYWLRFSQHKQATKHTTKSQDSLYRWDISSGRVNSRWYGLPNTPLVYIRLQHHSGVARKWHHANRREKGCNHDRHLSSIKLTGIVVVRKYFQKGMSQLICIQKWQVIIVFYDRNRSLWLTRSSVSADVWMWFQSTSFKAWTSTCFDTLSYFISILLTYDSERK
jgi:hypothetical protein